MDIIDFMAHNILKQPAVILKELMLLMFIDLEIQKVMIQKFSSLILMLKIQFYLGMIMAIQHLLVI